MSIHDDAEAARRKVYDDALAIERSLVSAYEQQVGALQRDAETLRGEVERLRARLAELEEGGGDPDPSRVLRLGLAVGSNGNLPDMEARMGTKVDMHRRFGSDAGKVSSLARFAAEDHAAGRTPFLSIKPMRRTSTGIEGVEAAWSAIGSGSRDAWLHEVCKALNDATPDGRLTYFTIHHEPDDEILVDKTGTLTSWQKMQHRACEIAAQYPRVRFGPILMGYHSLPRPGKPTPTMPLGQAIPADLKSKFDFIALDLYNTGASAANYKLLRDFAGDLECGICETGVPTTQRTAKPTWIEEQVAGATGVLDWWIWWSSQKAPDADDFRLDSDPEWVGKFADALKAVAGGTR